MIGSSYGSFIMKDTRILTTCVKWTSGHLCTLTFNELPQLMFEPKASRWLWPANNRLPPPRAH